MRCPAVHAFTSPVSGPCLPSVTMLAASRRGRAARCDSLTAGPRGAHEPPYARSRTSGADLERVKLSLALTLLTLEPHTHERESSGRNGALEGCSTLGGRNDNKGGRGADSLPPPHTTFRKTKSEGTQPTCSGALHSTTTTMTGSSAQQKCSLRGPGWACRPCRPWSWRARAPGGCWGGHHLVEQSERGRRGSARGLEVS